LEGDDGAASGVDGCGGRRGRQGEVVGKDVDRYGRRGRRCIVGVAAVDGCDGVSGNREVAGGERCDSGSEVGRTENGGAVEKLDGTGGSGDDTRDVRGEVTVWS